MAEEQKKSDVLTFTQWQNVIKNPPTSWTDYSMNWDDPNPQSSVYWMALVEALKQRYSVVRTTRDSYPFGNSSMANYVTSFKYNSLIEQRQIQGLCYALFSLANRFINPNKTDYQGLLKKYDPLFNSLSGDEYYFPSVIGYGTIMQKYPAIARFASTNVNPLSMSTYYLKDFLKQFKSAICELKYTKGGEVSTNWMDSQSFSISGREMQDYPNGMWDKYNSITTLQDIKKAIKARQEGISQWYSNTSPSTFQEDYIDSNGDYRGGWVGMYGAETVKDKYNDQIYYWWSLQAMKCKPFKHYIANPLNLSGTVYAYIYTGDIAMKDIIREDDYEENGVKYDTGYTFSIINDYCGLSKGLNVKQLGAVTNELKTYTIIDDDNFPWLWVSDLPSGDYGPKNTGNPLIYNNIVKGCCMMCSIVVKFNFRFS